ncbi:hypothetical protein, conserved [Leishmania tarentolae]|uniref:Uncharacterized protein n=1 Tax=Leishmania tarentolae TaxID=5689 RepID=A0A640KM85_LEITA|nr:hypothetical protein, conserved [Leishmania tarentolae]GET90371.1 hypothetical protein, conserved [Leishmania tarentolae]
MRSPRYHITLSSVSYSEASSRAPSLGGDVQRVRHRMPAYAHKRPGFGGRRTCDRAGSGELSWPYQRPRTLQTPGRKSSSTCCTEPPSLGQTGCSTDKGHVGVHWQTTCPEVL